MIGRSEIERAAAGGMEALAAWEKDLGAPKGQAAALTPWEQWEAALRRKMEFALVHHRTHRNRPLDLSQKWLREIYEDSHRHLVIPKSVKCGISEYLVVREFAEAAVGRSVAHVLPDHTLRPRFVAERIDKPMRGVPAYRELATIAAGQADNRTFKMFGDGTLFFLGSNTATPFFELVADTAIVDEKDKCNQENLVFLKDRMSAEGTVTAWVEVGNPTHPDYGISADYAASDQGEWQVHCPSCKTAERWRRVDWFTHVVEVERDDEGVITSHRLRDGLWTPELGRPLRAICPGCGQPVDHLGKGRWAFVSPGAELRGYQVSKLMTRQATLEELYAAFVAGLGDAAEMARFINNDLGLPHSPPGSSLSEALLDACRHDFGQSETATGPCTMGVDVGGVLDIRISDSPEKEVRRSRWIGRAPLKVEEVTERLKRYNVRCCVMDAMPETHFCREVLRALGPAGVKRHGVWLCRFAAGDDVKEPRKDADERVVTVDRTQIFDAATERIRRRLNWLPRQARELLKGAYYAMMQAPKRVQEEDARGNVRYVWTKGVDHARLADVYDELAFRLGGRTLRPGGGGGPLWAEGEGMAW